MRLDPVQLQRAAAETGFQAAPLEKVLQLLELLDSLVSHPFLKDRIALKGGTALNLFLLELPRLSVDIDLNYIGAVGRETMLAERPRVEQAVQAVCHRLDLQVKRSAREHAGGKWRLSHRTADGRTGTIEVDLNFLLRTPLWPPVTRASLPLASFSTERVPILDLHELAAGKLAALFGRRASRDVFDAREILRRGGLDRLQLRLAFVVYGAMSRVDWRSIATTDIHVESEDLDRQLLPLLRADLAPARKDLDGWRDRLVAECRELLTAVLPLEPQELEFLDLVNARGEIAPDRLTGDPRLQSLIASHPGLQWKALNVRRHLGLDDPRRGEGDFDSPRTAPGD